MASTSDKFRVLQELLGRLRSRRPNTSDLLPAIPWKDKGKGKAVTLDDDDDNEDGPSSGIPRLPGLPRGRASGRRQDQPDADTDADSDSDSAKQPPAPGVQKKRKRHRGGKRIPMAERRRRNRRTVQETLAPLRDVEFVEGPSWCPDDEKWCEGFGMW
ncbi:hypothetical protein L226DRAFT_533980 [Lentinus tigrinus ALCF2SS1-7]|uniref:uncharacterized protein n=1 Tax=Lentinus tigrinus ALCF2SS1-7 TaxID=1328758 RepID=UPI0011660117|nr:hypothetical protein L226DRAFT_541067 [Lentinus tigrinus ALCF2SS1-7]RPD75915.1 hypothetical protein L226DRAFT_533980 [Lentinus tigrinus ALCF2SS1-7]